MSEKLLPCPFCGSRLKMSQEPHDNHPVAGKFYIYHEYGPLDSAARECHLDIRGHFDTEADSVSFWNSRQQEVGYAYGPEMQSGKGGFHVSWEKTEHYNVPVFSIRADTKGRAT